MEAGGVLYGMELVFLHPFTSVCEELDSSVRAEAGRNQRRGRLREAQGRLGVHAVMQRRDEARVERVAAAGGVDDIDVNRRECAAACRRDGRSRRPRRQA